MNTLHQNKGNRALRAFQSLIIAVAAATVLGACAKKDEGGSLIVYAPDSFAGEWGPGPILAKGFTESTGIPVQILSKGDAGQVLAEAILEGRKPKADVIIGIDQHLLPKAAAAGILSALPSGALEPIPEAMRLDPEGRLMPFDHGAFAFIWDSEAGVEPPASLDALLDPQYRSSIILMDPRTSSPGLGFLAWTLSAKGSGWKEYWKALMPNVLAIAPGWDTGYNLFLKGEGPLVLSYTTSPAYHREYEKTDRYRALVFAEGHATQIEAAAILRGARHRKEAEALMRYLVSPAFQKKIPLSNWMFPVLDSIELPISYEAAPRVPALPSPSEEELAAALEEWPDVAR